jgi:hypothetical protein
MIDLTSFRVSEELDIDKEINFCTFDEGYNYYMGLEDMKVLNELLTRLLAEEAEALNGAINNN